MSERLSWDQRQKLQRATQNRQRHERETKAAAEREAALKPGRDKRRTAKSVQREQTERLLAPYREMAQQQLQT
jgi:hypothetical protein